MSDIRNSNRVNNNTDNVQSIVDKYSIVENSVDTNSSESTLRNSLLHLNNTLDKNIMVVNQHYVLLIECLLRQKAELDRCISFIQTEQKTINKLVNRDAKLEAVCNNYTTDTSIEGEGDHESSKIAVVSNKQTSSDTKSNYSMSVFMLSQFRVLVGEELAENWLNNKSKSIFKYLVTYKNTPVHKERLMDLLWPDSDPELARNNLNVAIHNLRKTLTINKDYPQIISFKDNTYFINPEIALWSDNESFISHYNAGKELENCGNVIQAYKEYKIAESLYQGEYLAEDRYDNWLMPIKQQYTNLYLILSDKLARYYFQAGNYESCIHVCYKSLSIDQSNEEAHCTIMKAYAQLGYHQLAIKQYHICKQILRREVDTTPSERTIKIFENILHRKSA
jgi:DNA-binding SARP family transcriptional activator